VRESTEVVVVADNGSGIVHHRRQLSGLTPRRSTAIPDVLAGLWIERNGWECRDFFLAVEPAMEVGPRRSRPALVESQQFGVPVDLFVANPFLVESLSSTLGRRVDRVDADDRRQWTLTRIKKGLTVLDERGIPL